MLVIVVIGVVVSALVVLSILRFIFLVECLTTFTNCLLNSFDLFCCVTAVLLLSNLIFLFGDA